MFQEILVLGATGNVDQPLVHALLSKGKQVKAASRCCPPDTSIRRNCSCP